MHKFILYLKMGGGSQIVAKLLGIFLLVTAGLKIHGLIVDPYGQENFLTTPWMQLLVIEVEVLLGLWLLSGIQQRLALFASLIVFIGFACLSFYLAWQGQEDCGCFGKVKVSPWLTFGLDVVIVAIALPCILWGVWTQNSRTSLLVSSIIQVAACTVTILGLLVFGLSFFTDDPWAAIARLRGESLQVVPPLTNLGTGVIGEYRKFEIKLINHSDSEITVAGGTTTCACIASSDLPVVIPARGTRTISVSIKYTGSQGAFSHQFALYSNSEERLTHARFTGAVERLDKIIPSTNAPLLNSSTRLSEPSGEGK